MALEDELKGLPPAKVAVHDVSKWYRTSRQTVHALDRVSLEVAQGEFVCLVGPSGCGKTTLLNVLARRESAGAKVEGLHLVNGTDPSLAAFQKLSSYVEQDDAVIGSLTVRETLNFASRLSGTQYV